MKRNENEEKRLRFERLLVECGDRIYSFAFGLTGNDADASDLVAEAWARALKSIDRFDERHALHSYLFKIVQNLYIDRRRRLETRKTVPLENLGGDREDDRPGEQRAWTKEPSLDFELDLEETRAAVPEPYREALSLCDMMELDYKQISQLVGVPVGTVRSRIFRGRELFRKAMRAYAEGG